MSTTNVSRPDLDAIRKRIEILIDSRCRPWAFLPGDAYDLLVNDMRGLLAYVEELESRIDEMHGIALEREDAR
jgi:hypothetical protein